MSMQREKKLHLQKAF
jgi:hypothetical protein